MHFSLVTLLYLLTTRSASAAASFSIRANNTLNSQCVPGQGGKSGGVNMCPDANFVGFGNPFGCTWFPTSNHCYSFANAKDDMHSIGPDFGGFCRFYTDGQCKGAVMMISEGDWLHE
jgi:hypothetical protein